MVVNNTIRVLLVNEEPLFQQGLRLALQDFSDLQVVAGGERDENLPFDRAESLPLVVLIEGSLAAIRQQCERLLQLAPEARAIALCSPPNAQQLQQLRDLGIVGYCPKNSRIEEIVTAVREVAAGGNYWSPTLAAGVPAMEGLPASGLQSWLYATCQAGLANIDEQLGEIAAQLADDRLGSLGWLLLTGRRRELRAARFAIAQLSPGWQIVVPGVPPEPGGALEIACVGEIVTPGAIATSSDSPFDRALTQLRGGLKNRSDRTLEIDILQPEKQRELLYLVLRRTREILEQWRFLEIAPEHLPEQWPQFLQQIWQSCALEFIGQYRTPDVTAALPTIALQDSLDMQRAALDKLPLSLDLLTHLLHGTPLIVDRVPYGPETPEARTRANLLLDNLLLAIANSIVQFMLNFFDEEDRLAANLYQPRYWSSREIARFRNDLSWQYRQNYYIGEPKAIFESRYRLLVLDSGSIKSVNISAPRRAELEELQGLRWLVTIVLEARDAIAPNLRAAIRFLGSGAVYLLTQVFGKALGLVGRGIVQGFGSSVRERRYRSNRDNKRSP